MVTLKRIFDREPHFSSNFLKETQYFSHEVSICMKYKPRSNFSPLKQQPRALIYPHRG